MGRFLSHRHPLKFWVLLIALLLANISVHAHFNIGNYYGERDAARLASDSIRAMYDGHFHDTEYTTYSAPLYSDALRWLLQAEAISISDVPFWMMLASLIASAIVTGAIFIFVFHLSASVFAAFGAALILQLIPVFWFNSLYGFPSMVALSFLMVSLIMFQGAIRDGQSRPKYLLLSGAMFMYILAVLTKVDIVMASAIYCLPVWLSNRSLGAKVLWVGCLALCSGVVFLLFDQYGQALEDFSNSFAGLDGMVETYPMDLRIFFSRENLMLLAKTTGLLSVPAALIGLAIIGWRKEWMPVIFWLVAAGLPLALHWGMRGGNSARHNLISIVFLSVILALPLTLRTWRSGIWAGFLCVIFLTNYFYFPAHSNPWTPSGRLAKSSYLFKERVMDNHLKGKTIADLPHEKIAIVGGTLVHPYLKAEVMRSSHLSYVKYTHSDSTQVKRAESLEMENGKGIKLFYFLRYVPDTSEIETLIEQGHFLVIFEENLVSKMVNLTEFQGEWMALDMLPQERTWGCPYLRCE